MNNINFTMYEPSIDSIIVNTDLNTVLFVRCDLFNKNFLLDDPTDIVYLYQLAENNPMTYSEFVLMENGLQDYVDAIKWVNY